MEEPQMGGLWIPQALLGAEPPAGQEHPGGASPESETPLEGPTEIRGEIICYRNTCYLN